LYSTAAPCPLKVPLLRGAFSVARGSDRGSDAWPSFAARLARRAHLASCLSESIPTSLSQSGILSVRVCPNPRLAILVSPSPSLGAGGLWSSDGRVLVGQWRGGVRHGAALVGHVHAVRPTTSNHVASIYRRVQYTRARARTHTHTSLVEYNIVGHVHAVGPATCPAPP
jgi:hypothetical protein